MNDYTSFNWKKWGLYIGVPLVVIVIIVLIVVFTRDKTQTPDKINDPKDPPKQTQEGYKGNTMPRPGSDLPEGTAPEASDPPIPPERPQATFTGKPATAYGGKVLSYKEQGNRAELEVAIAGNAENKRVFNMNVGSLVFDTKTNVLLTPSELEHIDASTSRFLVAGSESEDQVVEAVILNDTPDLIYSVISDVTTKDKEVLLTDNMKSFQYPLSPESTVINALTGEPYDLTKVKTSDRLFVYPSEGYESAFDLSDPTAVIEIPVDTIYIYPTKR